MFHEERCDFCGDCLAKCHYLPFDRKSGGEAFKKLVQGEKVEWLYDCVTCIACNEYCPKDARPFDLILQRMEELRWQIASRPKENPSQWRRLSGPCRCA